MNGFTVIELLVVIVIIAILAAATIATFKRTPHSSRGIQNCWCRRWLRQIPHNRLHCQQIVPPNPGSDRPGTSHDYASSGNFTQNAHSYKTARHPQTLTLIPTKPWPRRYQACPAPNYHQSEQAMAKVLLTITEAYGRRLGGDLESNPVLAFQESKVRRGRYRLQRFRKRHTMHRCLGRL